MIKMIFGLVFGTRNDKLIRSYQKRVNAINTLESTFETLAIVSYKSDLMR